MSASPASLLESLFAGSSTEELIAEEQEHQATEVSVPSVLGKRTSPSGGVDSDDDSDGESSIPGNDNLPSRSNSATHPNPGSLQVEQAIRRMAKRLKLSNENISLVEQFTQASIAPLVITIN